MMTYSVNKFNRFQNLLGKLPTEIVTITSNNGDGTSSGTTPSGNLVTLRGESVTVGNNAFTEGGVIINSAPNLTITTVNI